MVTDEELINGCVRGSERAQQALYNQYAGKMYAVCLRYARTPSDAADILQEGFVKVFTKIGQYHFQGSFEGWIRKIMVNTALRTYQRRRYSFEFSGYEQLPEVTVESSALGLLAEGELMAMINRLPEGYRIVFNMVAIEGYAHAEVADALGIQESTSRSQLTKARRWLAEQIQNHENYHQVHAALWHDT